MVFFCKYQEKSLPANFDSEKLDLLMEEYKNKVVVEPKKKQNKQRSSCKIYFS